MVSTPMSTVDPDGDIKDITGTLTPLEVGTYNGAVRDAVNAPDTWVDYPTINPTLQLKYNSGTDELIQKPAGTNQTKNDIINGVIAAAVVISLGAFTAKLMDHIFGTLSKGKSKKQLVDIGKANLALQKLIDEEESLEISEDELSKLEEDAELRSQGIVVLDVGCGLVRAELTQENLDILIDTVTNTTDSTVMVNAFETAFLSSIDEEDEDVKKNKEAMKDGFFKLLIAGIIFMIVASVTKAPWIRTLSAITLGFAALKLQADLYQDINDNRSQSECLVKSSKATMLEIIFNMIKDLLMAIIVPVTIIFIAAKIKQFLAILKSLVTSKEIQ
jgi:hypothetical protein